MRKSLFFKIAGQLICILATALFLFPLVLMLIRSFKGEGLHNYVRVFETVNLAPNFLTSITVVFATHCFCGSGYGGFRVFQAGFSV